MQESTDELDFEQTRDRFPGEMRVLRKKLLWGLTILAIVSLLGGVIIYSEEKRCLADPACKAQVYERRNNP